MIGWKDNTTGISYTDMPYCIYFDGSSIYIYEDGTNKAYICPYYTDKWYDIKIVQKIQGASYYYRISGNLDWIKLYDSTYSTESQLQPHIVHYDKDEKTYTDNWVVLKIQQRSCLLMQRVSLKVFLTHLNYLIIIWIILRFSLYQAYTMTIISQFFNSRNQTQRLRNQVSGFQRWLELVLV